MFLFVFSIFDFFCCFLVFQDVGNGSVHAENENACFFVFHVFCIFMCFLTWPENAKQNKKK